MADRKASKKCVGFGPTEGRCGKLITNPKMGKFWCADCNALRIEHLDQQFRRLGGAGVVPEVVE